MGSEVGALQPAVRQGDGKGAILSQGRLPSQALPLGCSLALSWLQAQGCL